MCRDPAIDTVDSIGVPVNGVDLDKYWMKEGEKIEWRMICEDFCAEGSTSGRCEKKQIRIILLLLFFHNDER